MNDTKLIIHHLNFSRSTRVLWLAEELGLPYELVAHRRDEAMRAPATLLAVHPLGKAPVVEIDGMRVAESGAIVELLCDRAAALAPAPASASDASERAAFLEWVHFAEGSAMISLMVALPASFMAEAATAGVMPFFAPEIEKVLRHLETAVSQRPYLLQSGFGGADIMNGYVVMAADFAGLLESYPGLIDYRDRLLARPSLERAIAVGGPMFWGTADV